MYDTIEKGKKNDATSQTPAELSSETHVQRQGSRWSMAAARPLIQAQYPSVSNIAAKGA